MIFMLIAICLSDLFCILFKARSAGEAWQELAFVQRKERHLGKCVYVLFFSRKVVNQVLTPSKSMTFNRTLDIQTSPEKVCRPQQYT